MRTTWQSRDTSWFVGKFLLLAVALQVVLELAVPMDAIKSIAGGSDVTSLLWAAVLGAPLPAHQIPVVPITRGLLDLGMDPGAAPTFLVAGPVTSIPALLVLWKVFERRLFFCTSGYVLQVQ
ncbi:permease [bacterium]|nr:permease [bacterium]